MRDDFQPGSEPSGSSNTLRSHLQPTVSPDTGSRPGSPAEDDFPREISNSSFNQSNRRRDTVSQLEDIVAAYRNEECAKTQALSQLLGIINSQDISEFQKGQTFDQYSTEISSIETAQKKAGKRPVNLNTNLTSENELQVSNQSIEVPFANESPGYQPRGNFRMPLTRKHEPSDGGGDSDGSDSDDSRPPKRPKLQESDMPWFPKSDSKHATKPDISPVNPSCLRNSKQLLEYSENRKRIKELVGLSAYAPDNIPSSQWDRILKGEPVDLNVILSTIHRTSIDQERTGSIGDKEISLTVSESKRVIHSGFEWSQAWRRASKAIAFLFPERTNELDAYGDYIESLFAAKTQSSAPSIVRFDNAVRNFVRGGQKYLLTDIQSFAPLYTAIVLPDGIESSNRPQYSSKGPVVPSSKPSGSKIEICNRFNSQNGCPSSDAECRYRHLCRKCRRTGHGQSHCNGEKK